LADSDQHHSTIEEEPVSRLMEKMELGSLTRRAKGQAELKSGIHRYFRVKSFRFQSHPDCVDADDEVKIYFVHDGCHDSRFARNSVHDAITIIDE
jgi:hypothetical protein